jgi:hypothetical protein
MDLLDRASRVADDWERVYREATQGKPENVYTVLLKQQPENNWIN